ncbi:hypothetical protein C8R44DRAFT_110149 [Mycena epipterygia]|nr:hypothetical protein C8R44DRAFT_110149 [Mycena epipterygia]
MERSRIYNYDIPPRVELDDSITDWPEAETRNPATSSFPYSAGASFVFPPPTETLLVLSHGDLSAGHLKITTSTVADTVHVHVTVHYSDRAVRDVAKVGLIKRNDGESGVGIFTPINYRNAYTYAHRAYFEVELTLPQSVLYINNLTTDVSNFSHKVDALKDIIDFGEIFLNSSNGKISIKSLRAEKATLSASNGPIMVDYLIALRAVVRSSNGPISGNYHVSDSLDLRTSNGPIKVTVGVKADDSNASKSLTMRTNNGILESVVNLSGRAGNFRVRAENSNGNLTTKIASLPIDAVLSLEAKTSNAPAYVKLPITYEGGFTLKTSNASLAIRRLVYPNEQDPAGKDRKRVVEINKKGGKTTGNVHWDRKNTNRGNVTLQSSNGPVSILL